jgi:hypothetical protein
MRYWNCYKVCPCLGFSDVELGTAPQEGDHHGRLAVEQTYGYMFHNVVMYGILTTVNSFAFLRRQRGGKLNLTRLIPATRTDPTHAAIPFVAAGYVFTSCALIAHIISARASSSWCAPAPHSPRLISPPLLLSSTRELAPSENRSLECHACELDGVQSHVALSAFRSVLRRLSHRSARRRNGPGRHNGLWARANTIPMRPSLLPQLLRHTPRYQDAYDFADFCILHGPSLPHSLHLISPHFTVTGACDVPKRSWSHVSLDERPYQWWLGMFYHLKR